MKKILLVLFAALTGVLWAESLADPFLWLEDVSGDKALAWVKDQNGITVKELAGGAEFAAEKSRLRAIMDSPARIPGITKRGEFFYNFWRDKAHPRGQWRRTTLAEYRKSDPVWESVLDLDAVATAEHENWVWKGEVFLQPKCERVLLKLSRGGGDAVVVREFDTVAKQFVAGGFVVPEAKSHLAWSDADTLFVATDWGAGSLTDSGYARIVKRWRRGTPLAEATTVFEGEAKDVGVEAFTVDEPGYHRELMVRELTTFTSETYLLDHGVARKLEIPLDADVDFFGDQLLVEPRTPWSVAGQEYPAGMLIGTSVDGFMAGERKFDVVFRPTGTSALDNMSRTRHCLILNELENVHSRIEVLRHDAHGWQRETLALPPLATAGATGVDRFGSDDYFLNVEGFLTPTSFFLGSVANGKDDPRELLKQMPAFFDAQGLEVSQHEAVSKDGTKVPYFQVSRVGLKLDGSNPTVLTGYGGFLIAQKPGYNPTVGAAWLERGGVYVLANIRGGGEFGPTWHESAIKANRQKAYDDFIAIAEDLVARKVTSPAHLGIIGGSNGGLLVGVMLTQRPDLFGAVVCRAPLLDMQRYNHLLAGASWMGEYGNPDVPSEWEYISKYSPYQNVKEGTKYPRVLFTTSTRDDRVHPGHARKMAAKMEAQGHDVLFYENIEGGHAGSANNEQQAFMTALAYTFLWRQLSGPEK